MTQTISIQNAHILRQVSMTKVGWITQVAWSPDGQSLAVAGADGVRLYVEQFGGAANHVLGGHEGHVKAVAFHPRGHLLASTASDMHIMLWDTSDMASGVPLLQSLTEHSDSIDTVCFSPDGQVMATGSADGDILLWDTNTWKVKSHLRGHSAEISSLVYALDGHILVSGSRDTTLRMWDAQSETEGTIMGEHADWVRGIAANPPGTMIATACKDGTVTLWDAHDGSAYANFFAHEGGADSVAFSPEGDLLATSGRDNRVRLWNVQAVLVHGSAEPSDALGSLDAHRKPVLSVAFNHTGNFLATGSGDNSVRLWAI